MVKVGVYCRLSDEDRDKRDVNNDSNSIQNQKSMLLKYALFNGWEVIDIYSDDDYSGAGTYRPDFERMIKDCESGRINLVLCKTQSRFSRDMEVIEKYLHKKFLEWGVRFVSIVDNADTNNRGNKKARQINGLINEWYLEDLSDNIKQSLKNKRDDGKFMGSFASYGYIKDPNDKHRLIIDEVAAEVVRKIFDLYKNGFGYWRICEKLNNDKITPPSIYKRENGSNFVCSNLDYSKARWMADTIARMLRNETYIGNLVQGKRTSISYKIHKSKSVNKSDWSVNANTHEPIIDLETWTLVQHRLNKHETPIHTGEIHFFSKKVYCEKCKRVFVRDVYKVKSEPDGRRVYLKCKGKRKYRDCNNGKSIRVDLLEETVKKEINLQLEKFHSTEIMKRQYTNRKNIKSEYPNRISSILLEKKSLEKKVNEKTSYYKNVYEDKIKGIITEVEFQLLRGEFLQEVENNKIRIQVIEEELKLLEQKLNQKDNTIALLEKYKRIDELNKVILDEFIDKIYIGIMDEKTKERDIIVKWNIDEVI